MRICFWPGIPLVSVATQVLRCGDGDCADCGALANQKVVFFSPGFLNNPDRNWRVRWNKRGRANPGLGWCTEPGTIVQLDEPHRIWLLTGERDPQTGYYEGCWPD